jgi:hypothetical protein
MRYTVVKAKFKELTLPEEKMLEMKMGRVRRYRREEI